MRRSRLAFIIILLVSMNALLAIYVFNYTTEVREPGATAFAGLNAMDRSFNGLITFGTEDGRIINPWGNYRNDAPITSLVMTDDALMVAFADDAHRVRLYFSGTGEILWTRTYSQPVEVVRIWVRPGIFFLEPTYLLVSYAGGFSMIWAPSGATFWSFASEEPFVMRATESGKILVGSGDQVSFFWLGSGEPYHSVSVEGPVKDLFPDAKGNSFLLLRDGEAINYNGITGEVFWRKPIENPTQAALNWNGGKSYLMWEDRVEILSQAGQALSSITVGEGRLLAPTASSYYFLLREDRIDAYYDGRPAPIWTASIDSPYQVYATEGGSRIYAWTAENLFFFDNTNPPLAARAWVGVFGTVVALQLLLPLFLLMRVYPLPTSGDWVVAVLVAFGAAGVVLVTGGLASLVELGLEGAFLAAFAAATVAALVGRRAGGPLAGLAIGLAVGAVAFQGATLLVVFYRYVFAVLPTFPAVEATIRSLTLSWLLGLIAGLAGGLSAYFIPNLLGSVFRRG